MTQPEGRRQVCKVFFCSCRIVGSDLLFWFRREPIPPPPTPECKFSWLTAAQRATGLRSIKCWKQISIDFLLVSDLWITKSALWWSITTKENSFETTLTTQRLVYRYVYSTLRSFQQHRHHLLEVQYALTLMTTILGGTRWRWIARSVETCLKWNEHNLYGLCVVSVVSKEFSFIKMY